MWDHFKDTTKWITEFNRILQEASSKDGDGETKDEELVDFVKIKMRVLFSQHLSYRVSYVKYYINSCFFITVFILSYVCSDWHSEVHIYICHGISTVFSHFSKRRYSRAKYDHFDLTVHV